VTIEFIDHTGDVGVRICAPDPAGLVEEAARAFYSILLVEGSRERVAAREERRLELSGRDGEEVLVDFLQELIYRFDAERLLLPLVGVEEARLGRGGARLRVRLEGERFDPARHALRTEVKAATYHGLSIEEDAEGLSAQIIFDL
jgi:SHS2 domain-containing protein